MGEGGQKLNYKDWRVNRKQGSAGSEGALLQGLLAVKERSEVGYIAGKRVLLNIEET